MLQAAQLVKKQIQVYKHIASPLELPLCLYLDSLLGLNGIDTHQQFARSFCEAACMAADSATIDAAILARRMHLSMCIKTAMRAPPEHRTVVTVLLDKLMSICAEHAASSPIVEAISHTVPGVQERLLQLHKWPHGFGMEMGWFFKAAHSIARILEKHIRTACEQGISPEEHVCSLRAGPRLQSAEAELLMSVFEDFWPNSQIKAAVRTIAAQVPNKSACGSAARTPTHSKAAVKEERSSVNAERTAADGQNRKAAAKGPAPAVTERAASASPTQVPADRSTRTEHSRQPPSKKEAAKHDRCDSCKAAEAREPSQHRNDRAADVAADASKGADGREPDHQGGQSMPAPDVQEAAQSAQRGLSEAEKAEKKRAKMARQRAARAQAAAQEAQAESKDSSELILAEGSSSAAQEERSAGTHATSEAGQSISDVALAAPKSLPAARAPALSSQATGSSRSSSLSPQPLLHDGMSHGQQESDLPWLAAAAPSRRDAQKDDPWQKVGKSRRKPVIQPGASKASTRKPPEQGRGGRDEDQPAPSASKLQTAAQQGKQVLRKSKRAVAVPLHAQAKEVAPKQPTDLRHASAGSQPQQPSQHAPGSLQLPRSQACPSSSQQGSSQTATSSSAPEEAHAACQYMPRSSSPAAATADFCKEAARDEDDLCIVCWENLREVVFYHCMHMCTCEGCTREIMAAGGLCPMCRASIYSTITARF